LRFRSAASPMWLLSVQFSAQWASTCSGHSGGDKMGSAEVDVVGLDAAGESVGVPAQMFDGQVQSETIGHATDILHGRSGELVGR